jgi:nucleotide-binding universal stress UspA family protein
MFKRILVPLDGSQDAEQALRVAARIACASKGSLLLVQVVTNTVKYGLYPERHAISQQEELLRIDHDAAMYYLKSVTYKEELAGLERNVEVLAGEPAECILSLIEGHHIDLIVMCRHGHTYAHQWTLGRTAHKIARHSPVPVLLVTTGDIVSVLAIEHRPVRALVGLDGSPLAEEALVPAANLVAALSAPAPGALHLMQVITTAERTSKRSTQPLVGMEQAQHAAESYLHATADRLQNKVPGLKLSITSSVMSGIDVASTLISAAERHQELAGTTSIDTIDLFALATHGRSGLKRWVIGSIAERVLGTTTLPLLLVRPQHK